MIARVFTVAVVPVLGLFIGAWIARTSDTKQSSWPIEPREQLALGGIDAAYRGLAEGLAPVVTSAETRAAIVRFLVPQVGAVDAAERDLIASVRRRLGIPADVGLVASGTTWSTESSHQR